MYNPQYVPCTEGSDEMVAVLLNLFPRLSISLHSQQVCPGGKFWAKLTKWRQYKCQ